MTPQDTTQVADEIPVEAFGEDVTEAQAKAQDDFTGEAEDAPAGAPGGDAEPEQLVALLEDARAKADGHWDQLLRTRAEMENLQRRQARELENAHKFALEGFVRELLQVRDSLELGQEAAGSTGADLDKLREGTALTLKLLADTMAKFGVEVIDPEGQPFNPELHQAMTLVPREDLAPNTVAAVVQRGYLLNGRLVRPAMVMVSRKP
jgi:molecular chaperone GrpE